MTTAAKQRTRDASVLILLLCAVMTVRLVVGGDYRRYVRNSMGVWLILAGLALFAGACLVARTRPAHDGHDHADHDHDHGGGRIGWLLIVPVLAVLVVAPRSLGTFAFDRAMSGSITASGRASFSPLPVGAEPASMSMAEFDQRAADRDGESFVGREVRLVGFVARRGDGEVTVARFQIACCAADARPHVVRAIGVDAAAFALDQWVELTGRYVAGSDGPTGPALELTGVRQIGAPSDPYEDG